MFRDIIDRGSLMTDPSFLVSIPTLTDPSLAPTGKQIYYVLFPTPNLDADLDWDVIGPRYRDECVAALERAGYVGFGDAIEVEAIDDAGRLGARGHGARRAVRRLAHLPPDRPVPAGQPRTRAWTTWCSPAPAPRPASAYRWC